MRARNGRYQSQFGNSRKFSKCNPIEHDCKGNAYNEAHFSCCRRGRCDHEAIRSQGRPYDSDTGYRTRTRRNRSNVDIGGIRTILILRVVRLEMLSNRGVSIGRECIDPSQIRRLERKTKDTIVIKQIR